MTARYFHLSLSRSRIHPLLTPLSGLRHGRWSDKETPPYRGLCLYNRERLRVVTSGTPGVDAEFSRPTRSPGGVSYPKRPYQLPMIRSLRAGLLCTSWRFFLGDGSYF